MNALARRWKQVVREVAWAPPTPTEIGVVLKAALAAGLAWWVARLLTDVPDSVLAPLTALVTVRVSVHASIRTAFQRSAAVVLGVFLALAAGDAFSLNGFTVGLLVALSLGVAELVLRLPANAATQVPFSLLVVLTAVTANSGHFARQRAFDTLIGAAVGIAVSLALPASRRRDARQTLERLAGSLGRVLEAMGTGLEQPWSTHQTEEWRRRARTVRDRVVRNAADAVGEGREAARWNHRDRRHVAELGRYEDLMPRLQRAAIGVSGIARGLDDAAHQIDAPQGALPEVGALLLALANAVRTLVRNALDDAEGADVTRSLAELKLRRAQCAPDLSRRTREALEHAGQADSDESEARWLSYAVLLVDADRIVSDLSAPLPA